MSPPEFRALRLWLWGGHLDSAMAPIVIGCRPDQTSTQATGLRERTTVLEQTALSFFAITKLKITLHKFSYNQPEHLS